MTDKREKPSRPVAEAPHYHGHRERLRGRFRQAGAEAVSDYELLELQSIMRQVAGLEKECCF
jgi:DNA repair protein RadC